jgi:hypothetical protein
MNADKTTISEKRIIERATENGKKISPIFSSILIIYGVFYGAEACAYLDPSVTGALYQIVFPLILAIAGWRKKLGEFIGYIKIKISNFFK